MSDWGWWAFGITVLYAVFVFMYGFYTQYQFKKEIDKRRERDDV